MKKRRLLHLGASVCLLLVMVTMLLLPACAKEVAPPVAPAPVAPPPVAPVPVAPAPVVPAKVYTLTMDISADRYPTSMGRIWARNFFFQRLLEERSDGRLKIDEKIGLFAQKETLYAVIDGRLDIAPVAPSYYSGTWPIWSWGSLPFIINDMWEYGEIMEHPKTRKVLDRLYRDAGLVYLSSFHGGLQDGLGSKEKPMATVADFKGMKVRTYSAIQVEAVRLLGGSAVSVAFAELYTALALGTIDAYITGRRGILVYGLYEFTDYVNVWPITPGWSMDLWISTEAFDALPADLQKILVEVGRETQWSNYAAARFEVDALRQVLGMVVEVVVPSAEEIEKARKITAPVLGEWLEKNGPDAKALIDAIDEVLAEYRARPEADRPGILTP